MRSIGEKIFGGDETDSGSMYAVDYSNCTTRLRRTELRVEVGDKFYRPGNVVPVLTTDISPFIVRQWPGNVQTYG